MYTSLQRGALLIQTIAVVVIVAILATIVINQFSNFREIQSLHGSVDEVIALVNEARSRTLAGDNDATYGVHLATNQVTLFQGPTYTSGVTTNRIVDISTSVQITSITLAGGGNDIIFKQLSGDTDQYGTLVIRRASTTTGQKTITITKPGLVSSN